MQSNSPPDTQDCGRCGHRCEALDDQLVYDVPDVMRILRIGRRSVEKLIRSGQLKSYLVLSLRKIDRDAVDEFLRDSVAPEYADRAKAS